KMLAGRLDQLWLDENPGPGVLQAALEDVSDAEVTTDLRDVRSTALVDPGGVSRDDNEIAQARQIPNDILDKPIGDTRPLGIVAHMVERKRCDGRLLRGQSACGFAPIAVPSDCGGNDRQYECGRRTEEPSSTPG